MLAVAYSCRLLRPVVRRRRREPEDARTTLLPQSEALSGNRQHVSRLQNSVGCGLNFWIPPVSILVSGMPTGRSGPEDGSGGGQKRGNAGIDVFTAALVVTAAGRAPEVEPRFAADALSVTSPSA